LCMRSGQTVPSMIVMSSRLRSYKDFFESRFHLFHQDITAAFRYLHKTALSAIDRMRRPVVSFHEMPPIPTCDSSSLLSNNVALLEVLGLGPLAPPLTVSAV